MGRSGGEWEEEERSSQIVISLNSGNKGSLENMVVYPSSNVAWTRTLNKSSIRALGGNKRLCLVKKTFYPRMSFVNVKVSFRVSFTKTEP